MREMYFKPLTPEDRKKHKYFDSINHAPYFRIFTIVTAVFVLFTIAMIIGVF